MRPCESELRLQASQLCGVQCGVVHGDGTLDTWGHCGQRAGQVALGVLVAQLPEPRGLRCVHTHCLATRCTQGVPDACWEKVRQGGRVRGPRTLNLCVVSSPCLVICGQQPQRVKAQEAWCRHSSAQGAGPRVTLEEKASMTTSILAL